MLEKKIIVKILFVKNHIYHCYLYDYLATKKIIVRNYYFLITLIVTRRWVRKSVNNLTTKNTHIYAL